MPRRHFSPAERADIEARLAAAVPPLGRELTRDLLTKSQALYAELHESEPYEGITPHYDVAYGAHERQRLDIFEPHGAAGKPRPVVLYVHGGGFVRGDKKTQGLPYFHNIGVWAARRGFLGVVTTYRLTGDAPRPAAENDVSAAVEWTRQNIARFGGNPRHIVLMGHSAGAVLVAGEVARLGADLRGIVGAVLGSGNYDFARLANPVNVRNYYGSDYAQFSPLDGVRKSPLPIMVTVGEVETKDFQEQALTMVAALFARDGRLPRFVIQQGQNHYTSCMRIGFAPDDPVERELEAFVRACGAEAT